MNEGQFWEIIEAAWNSVGGKRAVRDSLAAGKLAEDKAEDLVQSLEVVLPALRDELSNLSATDLLAFDRVLERKLYDLDRQEIQEHTEGSDDGFLYARGFVVAAGKGYYDAVNSRPSTAIADLECEVMAYVSMHLYEEKFGSIPDSGISRESCSNTAGWPDLV